MTGLSEEQLLYGLLALVIILVVGRGTAELARRIGQPEVLGELVGGFLLGPSILGALAPAVYHSLFTEGAIGDGLSTLSWIGAILLLLIAGLEVDLDILAQKVRPGVLAAAFAIIPGLLLGTFFAWRMLDRPPPGGIFLGVVLSVTAVSVAAKILIERDVLRRSYAQVILAAGVASEVLVWLLASVVSALHSGSPLLAGGRSALFAVLFFLGMMTIGRRFVFWAMRRIADMTSIINGQLSLILVMTFLAAALTQALGLHALLGAFVVGVLLSRAPRTTMPLRERIQTPTVGLFAPVFFVLAGMRVDILQLETLRAWVAVGLLFVLASAVKIGLGSLGARLGGLRGWESLLVGVGLNLKGGTDVIVAILGVELGLLSTETYTMYAVVAILTVMVSPPLITWLERRVPPSDEEMERLNREEAQRRAYLPGIERVLVPLAPQLLPAPAANIVEIIARAKQEEGETFDITQLHVEDAPEPTTREESVGQAKEAISDACDLRRVEVTSRRVDEDDILEAVLSAARDHGLIALGAQRPQPSRHNLSLGDLQDRIIDSAETDILVVVGENTGAPPRPRRLLVPVNGLEYSMKAGDVAAYLARACEAEIIIFNVMHSRLDSMFWREKDHRSLLEAGYRITRELKFRIDRLGVSAEEKVVVNNDPGDAIVAELKQGGYDLVVMGAVDRSGDGQLYLGVPVETVLVSGGIPAVLLVSHEAAGQAAAA